MEQTGNVSNSQRASTISTHNSLQAVQNLEDLGHPDAAVPASGLRFSLGPRPIGPDHYVPRAQSAELLELLKNQPTALIEVTGPSGVGKTTLVQRLIKPRLDSFFASYKLVAWIDCSSVSCAHADIQAISQTLGHMNLRPQAAMQQVEKYVRENPRSLLILDGLTPSNVDLVLSWLKPSSGKSVWSGQLIYTTAQTLTDKLSQNLEREVESLSLGLFTADQAKDLVQKCLPNEPLEACDFAQVIQMTQGYPGVIQELCQHYQGDVVSFRNFSDFLAQPEKHQDVRGDLLSKIAKASLEPLETEAGTNPITARALSLVKQASWLGDHRIPFDFFVNAPQQFGKEAIQMLNNQKLAILDIDRESRTIKLKTAFLSVVQKRYPSEQRALLEKNIQRLSKVFSYLTDNESIRGRNSQPEELKPYADLVHTLLFETGATVSLSENPSLRSQVLMLSSSLARLYYLYHGELQLAYDCLQRAQHFFKQGLSEEQIAHFERAPEDFTAPSITQEETQLLKLYAQEYLYQAATFASQLVPRGQVAVEVIQDFEKSYAIQVNLGPQGDPEAIAYTLRNLTRALRKQGRLVDALEEYQKLTEWMDRHPAVFDERTRAELLVDQGIIQKELEDAQPEGQRNYQAAIDLLSETYRIYLKHKTANQHQALGMLSIYLGEAYLAVGDFEKGITHTCQILHYDGKRRERQGRAYFNLARMFDEAGYGALAKLFIDKALPLQIKAYQSTTEALRLKIEKNLLQHHQQAASRLIDAQTASWETQASLAAYCEAGLLAGSAPSKLLSRDHIDAIEAKADNWLWQYHSKTTFETQQAALVQKIAALEAHEKAKAEKSALQLEQEKVWYRALAQRIDLAAPGNRTTRLFAHQFKEALLDLIIQQLRLAYGEKVPMDKIAVAEGLIQALSGVLPKIEVSATTGVTGTVDLAVIVQGLTKTLSDWQRGHQQAGAQRVADFYEEPEQQPKSLQVCIRIQQQIEEMAYYAAHCWQPVFSRQDWHEPKDIQTLAAYGARRVMDYLKTGRADTLTLSSQERVVLALMTGKANTRLTQREAGEPGRSLKGRWSVQGFFAQPGVKVETQEEGQAVYLPSWQARPNVYGYRFGSPVEARTRPYQGPFKSEAEAQQRAEAARHEKGRCTVM
ncbi:NACHT domain-containing protein [Mycoavidus sp. SF9855]|uniref:NACHT domain-containing protein n=1 Tax=Mycoavidus sp. SF9855 TaxID=2968475 RepID=UPI00211CAF1A|nr:NACHT domain-containing protein [Mycoavidus sp. SF9855]UUM22243.1 NACHT domain-containing protein [Mycoavidus sp. SF9855]